MKSSSIVFWAFASLSCGLLVSPLAGILHYLFPVMAIVTGLIFIHLSDKSYIILTLWVYFLTPVFRRLVDFRSSYLDPNPILLAPFLVTLVSVLPVLRRARLFRSVQCLPYLLALAAIVYGILVGVCITPGAELAKDTLVWIVPVIWGLYLASLDRPSEITRKLISSQFKWAWILLGVYGVF